MSTRSGKRLHSSFHENEFRMINSEAVIDIGNERKTRSKRLKENEDQIDVPVSKLKKRENYVCYPAEAEAEAPEPKAGRRPPRNTLKDHNIEAPAGDNDIKVLRHTRRTKKFAENDPEPLIQEFIPDKVVNGKVKSKKNKKKRSKTPDAVNSAKEKETMPKKKSKKKRKRTSSNSTDGFTVVNKSNTSIESFHSAAGSPMGLQTLPQDNGSESIAVDVLTNGTTDNKNRKSEKGTKKKKKKAKNIETQNEIVMNTTAGKNMSIQNDTFDKVETDHKSNVNDETIEKRRLSAVMNSTFDKNSDSNNTFDKEQNGDRKSNINNGTFDKINDKRLSVVLNSTFDKNRSPTSVQLNTTFDKTNSRSTRSAEKINSTDADEQKNSKAISLDSTFDKESKLDVTFDKDTNSIKSSDSAINITFDKNSVSITSDDLKTENIVNITPVLIESSLDESNISKVNTSQSNETVTTKLTAKPTTPLKREGTFTKEELPKSAEKPVPQTPPKDEELPAPGCTPFHRRSVPRQKSLVNVTRSLEKPCQGRRSSLMEPPRQTKVMFCSPMNHPAVVMQQKRKVIKSSLKGSNKSFVFEEKIEAVRSSRKRSLTAPAEEPAAAKRSRLAAGLRLSVDRLSRPRTPSAAAKVPSAAPSPLPPRTKLPNFAALHQKQFEQMESLGDCQQRRARRARRLLTPSGGVKVLDRSPKVSDEAPVKEKVAPVKEKVSVLKEVPKKPEPAPKTTAKPPLITDPLRTPYTRFGFKLNTDVNPFSVPSKVTKPKEVVEKSNGITRQTSQPSLLGTTVVRKDAAKQAVMREKSFTSLSNKRNVSRKENRTVIKGVRTNRRFELQMQMRNV